MGWRAASEILAEWEAWEVDEWARIGGDHRMVTYWPPLWDFRRRRVS